ncbi:MAG: hypothetical protein Kow00120_13510 [Anaerolineae bacterium]
MIVPDTVSPYSMVTAASCATTVGAASGLRLMAAKRRAIDKNALRFRIMKTSRSGWYADRMVHNHYNQDQ